MNRPFLILVLVCILFAGSVVNFFYLLDRQNFQLRGYEDPLVNQHLPFRVPRLGTNADLTQYDNTGLSRNLVLMHEAGIKWIRQDVSWALTEPSPDDFRWSDWDRILGELFNYPDMQLIPVFVQTPRWARDRNPLNATAPPDDPADLARFVAAFARRYGDSITYYQIWDEPNLSSAWGNTEPRPAEYAALLAACHKAIHDIDSDSQVIAAALAPTVETGPQNLSDVRYLEALYSLGASTYMDAVASKPYGFDGSPLDHTVSDRTLNFSRIVLLREIMVRMGDGGKLLWASNFGWNTLPANWSGDPSIWGNVVPEARVEYTLAALSRAEREWPWLGGLILQHWQPSAPLDDPIWGFSLIDPSGNPTELLAILRSMPLDSIASHGLFPAVNNSVRYSGVWTFGQLGADIGWVQDSQLTFNFEGSDVALLVRRDNYVAYLYVTIDGAPANALPGDADGNTYVVLTSSTREPELTLITVARGLGQGRHRLHLIADRGWDRWSLAGFAIRSGNLAEPYQRALVVGAIAMVSAFASILTNLTPWNVKRVLRRVLVISSPITMVTAVVLSVTTSFLIMIGMFLSFGSGTPEILRRDTVPLLFAIIASGLIRLQPGALIVIISVLVLFFVFYHKLAIGVGLTFFWAPFYLFPVELYRFAIPMAELVLLITVAASLVRLLVRWAINKNITQLALQSRQQSNRCRPQALDWLVAAYLIGGMAALSWSAFAEPARTEFRTLFLEPVALYWVIRVFLLSQRDMLIPVGALLAGGLIVAIIGLVQFGQGQAIITAELGARRLASVYGSPNNVALFLGRCIPFLVAFIIIPRDRRIRFTALVLLVPVALALALTQSIGAIAIGVPVSLAVVLLLHLRHRALIPLMLMLVAGVIAVACLSQAPRFARAFSLDEGTNFFRLRVWSSALNIIRDHPLTGLGLDQFLYAFRGRYIQPDAWQEPDLSHPHNILLDFWIRLGIAGVLLSMLVLSAFWGAISAGMRQMPVATTSRAVMIGTAGSMASLLAHGLVDNSVFVVDLVLVFILLLALAAHYPVAVADGNTQSRVRISLS